MTATTIRDASMNAQSPGQAYGFAQLLRMEIFFDPLGGEKDALFRSIILFDISQLAPGIVQSATLTMHCTNLSFNTPSIIGRSLQASTWEEVSVTWNNYRNTDPWNQGGGDFQADDPPAVQFISPDVTGLFTFPDISGLAQDAIDNRAGFLSVVIRLLQETNAPDRGALFASLQHDTLPPAKVVIVVRS